MFSTTIITYCTFKLLISWSKSCLIASAQAFLYVSMPSKKKNLLITTVSSEVSLCQCRRSGSLSALCTRSHSLSYHNYGDYRSNQRDTIKIVSRTCIQSPKYELVVTNKVFLQSSELQSATMQRFQMALQPGKNGRHVVIHAVSIGLAVIAQMILSIFVTLTKDSFVPDGECLHIYWVFHVIVTGGLYSDPENVRIWWCQAGWYFAHSDVFLSECWRHVL